MKAIDCTSSAVEATMQDALQQQLQEAAQKPRKRARKGRAGSPGCGESGPPGAALQQENAVLKHQVQGLQLAADPGDGGAGHLKR